MKKSLARTLSNWDRPAQFDWDNPLETWDIKEVNWKAYDRVQNTLECLEKVIPRYPLTQLHALIATPLPNVKVVIIGQDPYHTPGMADGLAFSCNPGGKVFPRTLQNIFKEYSDDLGFPTPTRSTLEPWAENGVLLLNRYLSVEADKPNSHKGIGWEAFTRSVVETISLKQDKVVFMLWGKEAQSLVGTVDQTKHLVLLAGHPSPLSSKDFFGCKHFSKACNYLELSPNFWKLT